MLLKKFTHEGIVKSMQDNPEEWVVLLEIQDKLIDQLEMQLIDVRARLEFFLKSDPGERNH